MRFMVATKTNCLPSSCLPYNAHILYITQRAHTHSMRTNMRAGIMSTANSAVAPQPILGSFRTHQGISGGFYMPCSGNAFAPGVSALVALVDNNLPNYANSDEELAEVHRACRPPPGCAAWCLAPAVPFLFRQNRRVMHLLTAITQRSDGGAYLS